MRVSRLFLTPASFHYSRNTHLGSEKATERLLSRAHGLLIGTCGAVGVVLGDLAGGGCGGAGELNGGLRSIIFRVRLVLLDLALSLQEIVSTLEIAMTGDSVEGCIPDRCCCLSRCRRHSGQHR